MNEASSPLCVIDGEVRVEHRRLLHHLNFSVQEGEVLAVIGPSGSGKTRLLETLAGLIPSKHGDIFLGGKMLTKMPARRRARRRGLLLPVDSNSFPMTIRQRLLVAYAPHRRSMLWSSRRANAIVREAIDLLALNGRAHERLDTLSRRDLRRVDLACLVVQRPRLWLLDEPNNHLSYAEQTTILDALVAFIRAQRAAAVMTLHDTALADRYADQVMMLNGRGEYVLGEAARMLTRERLTLLTGRPVIDADRDSALL